MVSRCGKGTISPLLLYQPLSFVYLFSSSAFLILACFPIHFYVSLSKYFLVIISSSFFVSSWSLILLALICYSSGLIPCSPSPLHASILMPPFPLLSGAFITLLSMFSPNPYHFFPLSPLRAIPSPVAPSCSKYFSLYP